MGITGFIWFSTGTRGGLL